MLSISLISQLLPESLRERFLSDSDIAPRLIPVLVRFEKWFDSSGLPFFKKFTDHSARHSLDVFRSGCEFLRPECLNVISTKDIAIFASSCFCHDAGMHLTETQFLRLISQKKVYRPELDSIGWSDLWINYLSDAKKFSKKKLIGIFGDDRPVNEMPTREADFTDRHRLLIGDFLRANHPRFAHDLAAGLNNEIGLPALFDGLDEEERDIVGLISRSHGCALRSLFPYISHHYDIRDFSNLHIVFLMCLLGLADYTQLQPNRAPITKLQIHSIESPISRKEWRVHRSIKNINLTHSDPEAIYVDAIPENVDDYLRLESWLQGIQDGLDKSWAILGEVYGRFTQNDLDKLQVRLRRVRSSLYEKNLILNYLPQKIGFKVAEAEMLALLLQPLYGDHPGYGVRELLQNAVDAVREAKALDLHDSSEREYDVLIEFKIDQGIGLLKISDSGIGMSAHVIKEYFLNAGASFRNSEEWRNTFVGADESIKIVRNGRFGVGALSAFMIGDSLTVDTRSLMETAGAGYHFTAGLYDEQINVVVSSHKLGSTICIPVSKINIGRMKSYFNIIQRLFFFDDVRVCVVTDYESERLVIWLDKPPSNPDIKITTSNYELIEIGRYRGEDYKRVPDFVNGIAIEALEENSHSNRIAILERMIHPPFAVDMDFSRYRYKEKSFYVTDRNAYAPLNLARNQFIRSDVEIKEEIARLAFAELCSRLPSLSDLQSSYSYDDYFFRYDKSAFVFNSRGMLLLDTRALNQAGIKNLVCFPAGQKLTDKLIWDFPNFGFVIGSGLMSDISPSGWVYQLRQIRQSSGSVAVAASVKSELIRSISELATLPMWLKGTIDEMAKLGENAGFLNVGIIGKELLEGLLRLKTAACLDAFTCIVCDEWRHRPPNWPSTSESYGSEITDLWLDKFAQSEGFFPRAIGRG